MPEGRGTAPLGSPGLKRPSTRAPGEEGRRQQKDAAGLLGEREAEPPPPGRRLEGGASHSTGPERSRSSTAGKGGKDRAQKGCPISPPTSIPHSKELWLPSMGGGGRGRHISLCQEHHKRALCVTFYLTKRTGSLQPASRSTRSHSIGEAQMPECAFCRSPCMRKARCDGETFHLGLGFL